MSIRTIVEFVIPILLFLMLVLWFYGVYLFYLYTVRKSVSLNDKRRMTK